MKYAVILLLTVVLVIPARAAKVQIMSPETPQEWSFGSIADHQLVWDDKKQTLKALIVFSNEPYVDRNNPRQQERHYFPFPGVTFDAKTSQFVGRSKKGVTVPLARKKDMLIGTQIDLLRTSRVLIFNFNGRMIVTLTGTTNQAYATGSNKWIMKSSGFRLQNAL